MIGVYHLLVYSNAYEFDSQMYAGYTFYVFIGLLVLFNFTPVSVEAVIKLLAYIAKKEREDNARIKLSFKQKFELWQIEHNIHIITIDALT